MNKKYIDLNAVKASIELSKRDHYFLVGMVSIGFLILLTDSGFDLLDRVFFVVCAAAIKILFIFFDKSLKYGKFLEKRVCVITQEINNYIEKNGDLKNVTVLPKSILSKLFVAWPRKALDIKGRKFTVTCEYKPNETFEAVTWEIRSNLPWKKCILAIPIEIEAQKQAA